MPIELQFAKWRRERLSAQILHVLVLSSVAAFLLLLVWRQQIILMTATALTWLSFLYVGFFAVFAKRRVVLDLWRPNDINRRLQGNSEIQTLIAIRMLGTVFIGAMLFMAYEILHDGFRSAYNNFGR